MNEHVIQLSYLAAAILFILSLRWLNHPRTARRGVAAGIAGKLQEIVPTRPITYRNQNLVNLSLLALAIVAGVYLSINPQFWPAFVAIIVLSLVFGVLLIIPIGGADMPTVISLLNSYAGLS